MVNNRDLKDSFADNDVLNATGPFPNSIFSLFPNSILPNNGQITAFDQIKY